LFEQLETCESADDVEGVLWIARANGLELDVVGELGAPERARVNQRVAAVVLAEVLEGVL
jgi:hypothetical protein